MSVLFPLISPTRERDSALLDRMSRMVKQREYFLLTHHGGQTWTLPFVFGFENLLVFPRVTSFAFVVE